MLKLPKSLQAHPHLARLEALLSAAARPLRAEGTATATAVHVALDEALRNALRIAKGTGHVAQGLEMMAQTLDNEKKGLRLVQEKTNQPPANRASRLLLLARDGSDRFYREAERILINHGDRTLAFLVDATGDELGGLFTAKGKAVKALMIDDKVALGLFLSASADALC